MNACNLDGILNRSSGPTHQQVGADRCAYQHAKLVILKKFVGMKDIAEHPVPTEIKLHRKSRVLRMAFSDGKTFDLPCEYLRVYSKAAEVVTREIPESGKEADEIQKRTVCRPGLSLRCDGSVPFDQRRHAVALGDTLPAWLDQLVGATRRQRGGKTKAGNR